MNRIYLVFTVLFLSFFSLQLTAQEKGVVRFFVDQDNGYFEIEINDTMLLRRYKDSLPAGEYTAKVWSPGYVVAPIDFTVIAGQTIEKHVKLVKNNDFQEYERNYKDYRMHFHKQLTVPLSISLATALTSGVFMVNAYTTKKTINRDIDLYYKSPGTLELDGIKQRVAENNSRYNKQRTAFYIGTGITFAAIGTTIMTYRHFKRNYTEPTYNKVSPFKEKYTFNITPNGFSFAINI